MYLLCEDVFFHHGIQTINSFNVNEAAGQSVFHVHIHLIPCYKGDVENPKGGVRGGNSMQAEILILFYR